MTNSAFLNEIHKRLIAEGHFFIVCFYFHIPAEDCEEMAISKISDNPLLVVFPVDFLLIWKVYAAYNYIL